MKPGYKQTEVGSIPDSWSLRPLGELGKWLSGGTPSMSIDSYWSGDIPWVSPKDMKVSRLHDSIDHITKKALTNGAPLVPAGAILVVIRGMILVHSLPVGRAERSLTFNQDIKAVIAGDGVDSNFLLHWLIANARHLRGLTTESTHGTKRLPTEMLFRELVVCPPPPEQEAIAEALSDADALIESLEQLLTKKRQIKKGTTQELLTGKKRLPDFSGDWEVGTFGDIFQYFPTANNSRSELLPAGDTFYIHYGDIHTKFHNHLDFGTVQPPRIDRSRCPNAALLKNGDWVMADASEDHEGVGKSIEVQGLNANIAAVAGLHTFLLREINPIFSPGFKGHLGNLKSLHEQFRRVATGMKIFGVSKAALKEIELPVPHPKEQAAIATILSDMDAEITALEAKLSKARQIKQGMMQELLTGRIRLV